MKSKEGRLLAGIGFGAAVIAGLIISQIGERPMGWATHRQTFPDPAPPGDTPFIPGPTGDCGEGFSAVIEYLHGRDPSSGDPLDQPKFLLMGSWNLVEPHEYSFATRIPRGTLNVDEAGLKAYPVTITSTADGITSTCNLTFGITGIEVGDEFVLDVPCVMEPNTPVSITVKLKDGSTVEVPDDILSPAGSIVPDNGSELRIRRTSDGSTFSDHKFRQGGQEKTGVPVDKEGDPFEFIDEGLYELELIWFEPPPPNGTGPLVEISRAKKKLVVGDVATVATTLGMTEDQLEAEICPPMVGGSCHSTLTISDGFSRPDVWGTLRCDGDGGFATSISRKNIRNDAVHNLPSVDPDTIDLVVEHVAECMQDHENKHVTWFQNNDVLACNGCCCFIAPRYPDVPSCKSAETDANLLGSIPCLDSKLTVLTLDIDAMKYLEKVGNDWLDQVTGQSFPGCP